MKIERISIHNVNSLVEINLTLNKGFNIICGPNGVGKTTILNCILGSFMRTGHGVLNAHAKNKYGFWEVGFERGGKSEIRVHYIDDESLSIKGNKLVNSKYVINFSVYNRNLKTSFSSGVNFAKRWLSQYYGDHYETDAHYFNVDLAKRCFNLIDESIFFSRVDTKDGHPNIGRNDGVGIFVNTPHGEILVENMSSGYQSTLYILLGLIKKVASVNKKMSVQDFEGILLIDEIDMHLHPEWQTKLLNIIRWLLPNAQVITTTHSPHIIQSAMPGEIIPLGLDQYHTTYLRDLPESNSYGYRGWTMEEILTDIMGLKETRSDEYKNLVKNFDDALDYEEIDEAINLYKQLNEMLHPQNYLKKILKLQLATLGGLNND